MEILLDNSGLNDLTKEVKNLPGLFKRAKLSAMKSSGFFIKKRIEEQIETGKGWDGLAPVTKKFYHKRGTSITRWQRRNYKKTPLHFMAKFSRYRVDDAGKEIMAGFGKSRKGQRGESDKFLMAVARRAENGEIIPVTDSMRNMFGATRLGRKKPQIGKTFFPLRKDTKEIVIPERPLLENPYAEVKSQLMPHFEDKFWKAMQRYQAGVKNK